MENKKAVMVALAAAAAVLVLAGGAYATSGLAHPAACDYNYANGGSAMMSGSGTGPMMNGWAAGGEQGMNRYMQQNMFQHTVQYLGNYSQQYPPHLMHQYDHSYSHLYDYNYSHLYYHDYLWDYCNSTSAG